VAVNPSERFDDVVARYEGVPGVTPPGFSRGFGRSALRVRGAIFAMVVRGNFVVKLSQASVDALVASGEGVRFDANKGVPMREWFVVDEASTLDWGVLADEALAFVGGARR
jgi:hypothetical protein